MYILSFFHHLFYTAEDHAQNHSERLFHVMYLITTLENSILDSKIFTGNVYILPVKCSKNYSEGKLISQQNH